MKKPIILCIFDGLGLTKEKHGNAFFHAKTPNLDRLLSDYPNSVLRASGEAVGLPNGQIGNSEVGHLCIGAGQIVYTGLNLVSQAIKNKEFFKNKALLDAVNHANKNNSTLHLMGLLSPGGVHSHEEHLFALLQMAHENKVEKVVVHAFGDGRDVKPRSIQPSITKLNGILDKYNYLLGSISGRYYAMDRDTNFELTNQAYDMLMGDSKRHFKSASNYVESQYQADISDEFLKPAVNENYKGMHDNDAVVFFNFRPDRARQLSHLIIGSTLYKAKPKTPRLKNLVFVSMMKYEKIDKAEVAFGSMKVKNPLGKVLVDNKLTQLRVAETQKYAHVTFFFDGGVDIKLPMSERILVPSLKVESYATAPQMSAVGITDKVIANLSKYDVIIMNYANCDMVGHTGDYDATVKALDIIDQCVGRLVEATEKQGGTIFFTADHGNAEIMRDENDKPVTKHSTSPVFLITTDKSLRLKDGILSNISPTILDYLGLNKPSSMDCESLIVKEK